jgi:predicted transcriptional regulator
MGKIGVVSRHTAGTERQHQARADRAAVLALIRQAGPLSSSEIARLSGLTPTQVRRRIEELQDLGEIEVTTGQRWAAAADEMEARRA